MSRLQDDGLVINDRFKVKAGNKSFKISDYTTSNEKRSLTLNIEDEITFRDKLSLGYKDSTKNQTEGVIQISAMIYFVREKILTIDRS